MVSESIAVVYSAKKKKKKGPIVGRGKVAKLLSSLSKIEHVLVPFAAGAKTRCLEHLHPEVISHLILTSQKITLSIIPYNFTIHPAFQLLFSYSIY